LKVLLGPSQFLDGEDASAFDALYEKIRSAVAPRDVFEEMWAWDVVVIFWETFRLWRQKVKFLRASAREGLIRLTPLLEPDPRISIKLLVERWAKREPSHVSYVETLLEQASRDQEAIAAEALVLKLVIIERIERMITEKENSRSTMLR
jgi:hypothetical protein